MFEKASKKYLEARDNLLKAIDLAIESIIKYPNGRDKWEMPGEMEVGGFNGSEIVKEIVKDLVIQNLLKIFGQMSWKNIIKIKKKYRTSFFNV